MALIWEQGLTAPSRLTMGASKPIVSIAAFSGIHGSGNAQENTLRNVHQSVNAALHRIRLLNTRRLIRPLDACRSFGGILSRLTDYFSVIYSIGQRIADPSGGVRTIC